MTDYQPLNYRLRCHTKRGDIPPDVLRDICEAYVQLLNLEEECTKKNQMQAERDEARRDVCSMMHMTGFLGGDYAHSKGWDCFKDGHTGFSPEIQNFRDIFYGYKDKLKAERDEARREICENVAAISASVNAKQWAQERGWDCYKGDGK